MAANGLTKLPPVMRQSFMTREMWFTWLLREDVRGAASPDNAEGQRDFVAWWILSGPIEYPRSWSIQEEQVAIAMEPVLVTPWHRLPRLLRELYRRRPDLQQAFPLLPTDTEAAFLAWYRVRGPVELPIAPPLPPGFLAISEHSATSSPWCDGTARIPWVATMMHKQSAALMLRFDVSDPQARQSYGKWFAAEGAASLPSPRTELAMPRLELPALTQAFGVNLVGYPRGEFGIGEDIRMMSAALEAVGVPHVVIDLQTGSQARQQDNTVEGRIRTELEYGITVFCQSAFDTVRTYLEQGPAMFERGITVGNWPWELASFPACWSDVYGLVTEVWAASRFSLSAYKQDIGDRARLLPPAVEVSASTAKGRLQSRQPATPFGFFCPFDPNSRVERKNPVAAIRAFRAAFPVGDEPIRLTLQVNGNLGGHPVWRHVIEEAAEDQRIAIAEGTLDRPAFLARMRAADCLVSSHRSEGFGRNMAEAILMGVQVLGTGYSGCMDFLQEQEAVAYELRPVATQDYPYGAGMTWADPDIEDLARRMRLAIESPRPRPARAASLAAVHGLSVAGERYRQRLATLHALPRAIQ